jgi:hypothetical protein
VVLVVLELLGPLVTELEIRDWELANSVTELSCLTHKGTYIIRKQEVEPIRNIKGSVLK